MIRLLVPLAEPITMSVQSIGLKSCFGVYLLVDPRIMEYIYFILLQLLKSDVIAELMANQSLVSFPM